MDRRADLTAPCGLPCFACPVHEDNLTDALREQLHHQLGVAREEIACRGCRDLDPSHFHLPEGGCATRNCAEERGVALCSDCGEFPCALLAPVADGADRYPHNVKLYNLCRIRRLGLEAWLDEAQDNGARYFATAFVVGKGQGD